MAGFRVTCPVDQDGIPNLTRDFMIGSFTATSGTPDKKTVARQRELYAQMLAADKATAQSHITPGRSLGKDEAQAYAAKNGYTLSPRYKHTQG